MSEGFDNIVTADRLGRRRARLSLILAVVLMVQQGAFLSAGEGQGTSDAVRVAAWLVLSLAVVAVLWTGGSWLGSRPVRALLDDETVRANRQRAMALGFLNAMVTATGLYAATQLTAITAREALHVTVTVGLASALIGFATLERLGEGR